MTMMKQEQRFFSFVCFVCLIVCVLNFVLKIKGIDGSSIETNRSKIRFIIVIIIITFDFIIDKIDFILHFFFQAKEDKWIHQRKFLFNVNKKNTERFVVFCRF